jgi:hypothetical protein
LSEPRTPSSPPESPTSTLPAATSGAIVTVSPLEMSATGVRQTCAPELASSAITCPSSVTMNRRPLS